ncbi:MAG: RagB/SusD family nutrient uptake outer membrane protein [Tannerellaceae bacterium]|jgi:hypothetical protein|nr:RagB/SusD family nutrient uptake outer membrane protein [Tannerellaceae bacterium]
MATISVVSCDDFLREEPRSERDAETFFQDASDAYSVVNRLYRIGFSEHYNQNIYAGSYMMDGGYLSGFFENEYKGQEVWIVHSQTLSLDGSIDNNHLQAMWERSYRAIVRHANYAIANIPDCPGLTDQERSVLLSEAKFFRALNYFYLVKNFGEVPLITDYYKSLDNLYVRRSNIAAIYNQMVKDLTEALDGGLASKSFPENGFRISKGSVAALLADVYLNMAGYPVRDDSKYAQAAVIAKSLIDDPAYVLIRHQDLEDNSAYNILRTSDTEKEYLYTIEYAAGIQDGSSRPMWCFPNTAATWGEFRYVICNNPYQPDPVLLAVYDKDNDLRIQERQYFHTYYQQRNGNQQIRNFGGPIPYFWWEEEAALVTGVSVKDQTYYRLAEMYLIAAEATVRANNSVTDEAVDYLATIQARASVNKDKTTIKSELLSLNLSVDQFVEEVWKEKIREFIFEFKLWNDITRTRKYPATDSNGTFYFVDLIGAKNPFGHTFTEDKIYFPICSQELQRNPMLTEASE